MRGNAGFLIVFTVLLLLSPTFLRVSLAQPSQGNWTVTGTQMVQNESITLNGNLTVESGGSLTLDNVKLVMNGQFPGEYSIYVAAGGSLYIYGSTISASNQQDGYSFVATGTHFVMKGSSVHGVGWCTAGLVACDGQAGNPSWYGSSFYPYGLEIFGDNAVVEDDVISGNTGGIWIHGNNETITETKFTSESFSPLDLWQVTNSKITSDLVNQSTPFGGDIVTVSKCNYDVFNNDTILNTLQLIGGNEIGGYGMDIGGSWHNVISDSLIKGLIPLWLQVGSSDNTIVGNTLEPTQSAVYLLASVSNRILNNTVRLQSQYTGGDGFYLTSAHNTTIAGNVIEGSQGTAMFLWGTSGTNILDNSISTPSHLSISLFGSQGNTIEGNSITNTQEGISLSYQSNGNTVTDNNVVANNTFYGICCGYGIYVKDSSYNSIFGNNFHFVSGDKGPYDNGTNTWSFQSRGNYWSDFTGTDADKDGVIDQPFGIGPNGTDPYPLVNPASITAVPVVYAPSAPTPQNNPLPNLTDMTISNQNAVLGGANVDVKISMTIERSTVTLGTDGPFNVNLGQGATLLIDHSTVYWYQGYAAGPVGSNIIITNSVLVVGQKSQFHIGLFPLIGSLRISNSTIMSTSTGFGWTIENRRPDPGSSVVIDHSKFYSYGTASQDTVGPIPLFYVTTISITHSYFAGCQDGLVGGDYNGARGDMVNFSDNTFHDVGWALFWTDTDLYVQGVKYNSSLFISGNAFSGSVEVIGGNLTLTNNTFQQGANLYGVSVTGTRNNIYGNLVTGGMTRFFGNYFQAYNGRDPDLDGIGDTHYISMNSTVVDSQPYMQPNGWLTKFYLTVGANVPSLVFAINGSSFQTGQGGVGTYRLGYDASYSFAFPQSVTLANGTSMVFSHWNDGDTSPTRTLHLSSNSTEGVIYKEQAVMTTTTTSSTSTNTSQTTTTTTTSSASATTQSTTTSTGRTSTGEITTTPGSTSSTTTQTSPTTSITGPGGIPEFPYRLLAVPVFVTLLVVGYLLVRRRQPRR